MGHELSEPRCILNGGLFNVQSGSVRLAARRRQQLEEGQDDCRAGAPAPAQGVHREHLRRRHRHRRHARPARAAPRVARARGPRREQLGAPAAAASARVRPALVAAVLANLAAAPGRRTRRPTRGPYWPAATCVAHAAAAVARAAATREPAAGTDADTGTDAGAAAIANSERDEQRRSGTALAAR